MHFYLFAANLFTLTAFLLGLSNFSRGRHSWRLVPLFFLVTTQSISLMITLAASSGDALSEAARGALAALNTFSAVCLVWTLIDVANLSETKRRLSWIVTGVALFLSIFPLIPNWPVPFEIHILIITMFGSLVILTSLDQINWLHLLTPFVMAWGALFSLLEWSTLAWGSYLLAYALLIAALHSEQMRKYQVRQVWSEHRTQEAIQLSQEKQRLLETTEIINAVPSLTESLPHIARSLAHITDSDLAAVLFLDIDQPDQLYLGAVYPRSEALETQLAFELTDYLLLQKSINSLQQQLAMPHQNTDELKELYRLWQGEQIGPTLLQPLVTHGRAVGVLALGNPITSLPFQAEIRKLCQTISTQVAVMVEAYRRYHNSELQRNGAETLAVEPTMEMQSQSDASSGAIVGSNLRNRLQPVAQQVTAITMAVPEAETASIVFDSLSSQHLLASIDPEGQTSLELNNYLTILEVLSEGVVVSANNGRVWLVNRAAERILGRSRKELMGQSISTIYGQIDSGEAIEDLAANFSRRNEPLPTFYEDEERAIRGQLVPWRNADKEWLGIVAIFKDVTNSVRADRARDNFIYALSRTLREPLAVIKGYAELSVNGQLEEYSADQLRIQHIIHTSVDRVIEVLNNSIQVNTQTKHKVLPRFETINPIEFINEALDTAKPLAELRDVSLKWEISSGLPLITVDRNHAYQILENLLSNACRFTPPSGQVTLRSWIQEEREGNKLIPHLMMSVSDNGVGIPKKDLKRIFEPFVQLDNQPPLEEPGMGMGLAVVKELAQAHNGRVWVESAVGEGSVFFVALPLTQD